jgi:diguanylate cyclase (GGDEF)-like protein
MVRSAIEELAMPHRASGYRHVTVSIGLASTCPNDARPSDLIEAADAALYAAKHRGRNLVVEHGFARISDALGEAEMGTYPAASFRSS